jgi:hypothetical protein
MTKTHELIVAKAFDLGCVVFGGYVRDLIAGLGNDPGDIDIKLNPELDVTYQLSQFLSLGGVIKSIINDYNGKTVVGLEKSKGAVYKLEIGEVKVDLVVPNKICRKPDVNVNLLEMSEGGIRMSITDNYGSVGFTMPEIIWCIQNKKYVPEWYASRKRIAKIEGKGYTRK